MSADLYVLCLDLHKYTSVKVRGAVSADLYVSCMDLHKYTSVKAHGAVSADPSERQAASSHEQ